MKIKSKLQFPVAIAIMSFAVFSMIFQGCEKEELTPENDLPFLSIDGDLNAITLLESPQKMAIYSNASKRIYKYLSVIDGKLHCSITNGSQIGISSNIFEYMTNGFNKINNQIKNGKIVITQNIHDQIFTHNPKISLSRIKRLKSGEIEENEYEYTNFSGYDDQSFCEYINSWTNDMINGNISSSDYGSLNDHFDIENMPWNQNTDSWGIARITKYGTINNCTVECSILNPCFQSQDPNCGWNNICTNHVERKGNDLYLTILSCTNDPLVAVRYIDYYPE